MLDQVLAEVSRRQSGRAADMMHADVESESIIAHVSSLGVCGLQEGVRRGRVKRGAGVLQGNSGENGTFVPIVTKRLSRPHIPANSHLPSDF